MKEINNILLSELIKVRKIIADNNVPIIIVLTGFESEDVTKLVGHLTYDIENKCLINYDKNRLNKTKFLFKKYWNILPKPTQILILSYSWYDDFAKSNSYSITQKCRTINAFEKTLTDNNYIIIKINNKIKDNNNNSLVYNTNTKYATWNSIQKSDTENFYHIIIDSINKKIKNYIENSSCTDLLPIIKLKKFTCLTSNDNISNIKYSKNLYKLQKELVHLQRQLLASDKSIILAFEGYDASGKGGNIKRITRVLDPRYYTAISISSPTQEELQSHYLKRFTEYIPERGKITIFDRTWYGRILVERVDELSTDRQINNAYNEINYFEKSLRNNKIYIIKFWLDINDQEQFNRLKERQLNPNKKWKITSDDWKNRKKREAYETAASDMFAKTSTNTSKWIKVDANDKKSSRILILKEINKQIKKIINKDS